MRPTLGLASVIKRVLDGVWGQWAIDLTQCLAGISFLTATATLNFGNTAAQSSAELTIAVIGAAVGNAVALGLPAAPDANSCYTAYVSAPNVVTVRFNNYSVGAINPPSASFTVWVFSL